MERKLTKVVDGTEITVSGKMCSCGTDVANHLCSWESTDTRGDCVPFVKKSPINQRFLRFWKKNGCVFLFPQSDDIIGDLPQGIGFWEQKIYILAKGYTWAKGFIHYENITYCKTVR